MEDSTRTDSTRVTYGDPYALRFTSEYLRRLIIECAYIMAKVHNPGGSVILTGTAASTESPVDYSSEIGNTFHNDLIDAGVILKERFSKEEREALYTWALGMTPQEASQWTGVKGSVNRKRRQRAVEKLAREMADGDSE